MLKQLRVHDSKENAALKRRYQELEQANEAEKKQWELQMKQVIHSHEGQLVSQRQRIANLQQELQGELAISQNKIAEQEKEIKWLKKYARWNIEFPFLFSTVLLMYITELLTNRLLQQSSPLMS